MYLDVTLIIEINQMDLTKWTIHFLEDFYSNSIMYSDSVMLQDEMLH